MTTGIKESSAGTSKNQEQVLCGRALVKGQREAKCRKDMVYHVQINVKNILFEARKKATLESVQPFWPPSTTGAYCTLSREQRACGGRHITWFPHQDFKAI